MEKKEVWSTSDIIANRNNWSLAADVELLKHLQALSEKIFTKASSTLHSLNSFENDVNQTCISIANTSNKFKSLSDTQFIESKVQEESADISEPSCSQTEQPPADRENENITVKLKQALENGFRVLDTQYDLIPVSGSDSEDDEPQEILLRARNPYLSRRLPHIIGSEEFTRNDNLGLIDSSSSEEEEEEEEEEEDDDDDDTDNDREEEKKKVRVHLDEDSIIVQKPPPLKTEFIRPRTEIIRISSSDSEDSEESIPCNRKQGEIISESNNKLGEKSKDDEPVKNLNSFAEHLNAALKNNPRHIYSTGPPDFEESFSPPPFPGKDNSISSDDDSDDSSDIFATKKNTKQPINNTNYKPNYENESDVDNDYDTNKIGVISKEYDALRKPLESSRKSSIVSKTSQYSNSSNSSSMGNEVRHQDLSATSDQFNSQPLPKSKINESNINNINRKMVSAINSELSAKLNLKNSPAESIERLSSGSLESRTSDVNSNKVSRNNTPVKASQPKAAYVPTISSTSEKTSQESTLFKQPGKKSSSEEDDEDDLFRTVKKSKSKKEKSEGLFDDDGNIENLFSPLKSTSKATTKTNDLFSSKPNEPKSDKIVSDSDSKPPVVDLFKKSDLFASDSESEDDIFSMIKNKKKPADDIFSPKAENIFGSVSNDLKRTPEPSNDSQSTKTSIIECTPSESKSQTLLTENETNDFNSLVKFTESAKKIINDDNVISTTSSFENRLSDDVKTTGDLFQSDDDDDLFSKTIESADNRASVCENANASKSGLQSSIVSSVDTVENVNIVNEKEISEISSNIHRSPSSVSTNEIKTVSSLNMESTHQSDKKGNIFSKIQTSKYSSSSEDEIEDTKNKNIHTDFFGTSLRNQSEESDTDKISKKEIESNDGTVPTRKEGLFDEQDDSTVFNKNSKTKEDDIFGESYESRSAVFLPPIDDFSEGLSEDEEIKDNNYLSQEDDDFFSENFEPPPFQQAIPDDDIFGEKRSTNSPPELQKNVNDAFSEDLFAKSSTVLSSTDLFHENDIFGEKNDSLKNNPKLLSNQVRKENKEMNEDSDKKLLVDNKEEKNDVFGQSTNSDSFNFDKRKLLDGDADESSPIFEQKISSVSLAVEVNQPKDAKQIISSDEVSSPNTFKFFQDQIQKQNENSKKHSADEKPSSSPKVGKINTNMFEKNNIEKKLSGDVQDGNVFVKSTSPESVSSSRNIPGKLAMNRSLNINVNALLPGGNWSSKMKQKQDTEHITPNEKPSVEPVIPNKPDDPFEQSTDSLSSVIKERPKVSGKRRPPSRQARKSRMVNDDIFGDGFGTEFPQEKEESNIRVGSPKLPEKAKIEKSGIPEDDFTSKNIFFDNESKTDDLFGIKNSEDEFSAKQPVNDPQISNASFPEKSSSDLNLDVESSLNPLPSLTKNRPKSQKRSSAPKKLASDILSISSDKDITKSEEVKSKSNTKPTNSSSDESLIAANLPKPTPASKSIFDSLKDDDEDLFESLKFRKTIEEKLVSKVETKIESKPMPEPSPLPATAKSKTVENAKINIFDDDEDDQLFSSTKKKLSAGKLTKKSSLFEDNDDDDLFGTKTSTSSSRKTSAVSSAKTKVQNEKPRVVKLRSETVQKDPLTGKDLGGPL